MKVRVLCIEDHAFTREGIKSRVNIEHDMEILAAVGSAEEGLALFLQDQPDVTLMDLQLPGMSGLEAIRRIRSIDSQAPIVVLTMYDGDEDIHRALRAGASTYLLKDMLPDDLIRVIREVHAGQRPIPAAIAERLVGRDARPALTEREVQVLELIAKGMRNKEIAAALEISEETVQSHARNIFGKLDVQDRTAAITIAARRGIIRLR
jgi:two-component system, NarL family, response regulator